eukprot:1555754-Ditylum_brightwellii.AAC.1
MAIEQLPLEVQLNVMVDADVNKFRAVTPIYLKPSMDPLILPSNKAFITINGTVVISNLQYWLRDNYNSSSISAYIRKRTGLFIQDMEWINWNNLGAAYERQKLQTE